MSSLPAHDSLAGEAGGHRTADGIFIHSDPAAWEGMRRAGRLAAEALDALVPIVRPGITTQTLDDFVAGFARDNGAICAPLNYRGFTRSICVSPNHVVCHGIPGEKIIREGDILNIDVTLIKDGWHGDTSRMFWAGEVSRRAQLLTRTSFEAMHKGIALAKAGRRLSDIGATIEDYARARSMTSVQEFTGHGIGRIFHDEPSVFHCGPAGMGPALEENMFFTIEPMINLGKAGVKVLSDGWTAVTRDRSLSAQFEHTIGITAEGCEIFTLSPAGLHCPPYSA